MEVMVAGRKGPGVEDPPTSLPVPPVGSIVEVTGVPTFTRSPNGKTLIRIRPLALEDIQILVSPPAYDTALAVRWLIAAAVARMIFLPFAAVAIRTRPNRTPEHPNT